MPKIEIKNLKVCYYPQKDQELVAIDDLTLSFKTNSITAIIGPSGCGKSTLLKTVCGLLDYEGEILVDDKDYSTIDFKERNISFLDQEMTLNRKITIYENIAFPLLMKKTPRQVIDIRIKEIASELGISHCLALYPHQLSVGQCQKALLEKSIIKNPTILLCDEAFSNLDLENSRKIAQFLKNYCEKHEITVLFVTHNFKEIQNIVDEVKVLDEGKLIFDGTSESIYSSQNEFVQMLIKE